MKEKLYPWLRQLTLRQMRGFEAVVDSGSVSAAARSLHLTPPAVSLQLRDLENAIGLPLLERGEDGLVTTRVGQELLEMSREFQASLDAFAERIDELKGVDHGVVSVGVVSTARYFAPMVLAEFLKLYPEVRIQLQVGNRDATLAKLERLELDFAITGSPPEHFEVKREYIGKNPQILIAPPDHPLANKARIPLSGLRGQTFLLREPGSGTRAVADRLFARDRELPGNALEFGSNETIKQAVMAGLGIALISAHTVAAELDEKRLVALNVRGLPIHRKWFLVKHAGKRFLPSAETLWKFIARNGRHYLPKL
ncbi:MAG TPA: LysR family transcriptional regulator [Gammaproteobacteria bacterium]|jgi:LysR family transcriptional regulator for metE and metH